MKRGFLILDNVEGDTEEYVVVNLYSYLKEGFIPTGHRAETLKMKIDKYFENKLMMNPNADRKQELENARELIFYFLDAYIKKCTSTDHLIEQIKATAKDENSAFVQFLIEFLLDKDVNFAFVEFYYLTELSRFLFTDQVDLYLSGTLGQGTLPKFDTLWSSIEASFNWKFDRDASNQQIAKIRACYMKHVENFMASRPISGKLLDGKDYYGTNYYFSKGYREGGFLFSTHTQDKLIARIGGLSRRLKLAYAVADVSSNLPEFYTNMIIRTPMSILQEISKINGFMETLCDQFNREEISEEQFEFKYTIYEETLNSLHEFWTTYGMLNHEIEVQHRWLTYLSIKDGYNWYSRDFAYRWESDHYRIKPQGIDYDILLKSLSLETRDNFIKFINDGITNPQRYLDAKVKHDWPFDNEIFDNVIASSLSNKYSKNRLAQIPVVSDRLFEKFIDHFHEKELYSQYVEGDPARQDPNVPKIAKKIAANLPQFSTKSSSSIISENDEVIISHRSTGLALNLLVQNMPECVTHEYFSMETVDIDGEGPLEQNRLWGAKEDLLFFDIIFYGADLKPGMSLFAIDPKYHFINGFAQQIVSSLSHQDALGTAPDAEVDSILFNYGIKKDGNNIEVVVFKTKLSYMKILEFLTNLQSTTSPWKSDWVQDIEETAGIDDDLKSDYSYYSDAQTGIRSRIPDVYKKFLVDYWEIGHIEEYVQRLIAEQPQRAQYWQNWLTCAETEISALRMELLNA